MHTTYDDINADLFFEAASTRRLWLWWTTEHPTCSFGPRTRSPSQQQATPSVFRIRKRRKHWQSEKNHTHAIDKSIATRKTSRTLMHACELPPLYNWLHTLDHTHFISCVQTKLDNIEVTLVASTQYLCCTTKTLRHKSSTRFERLPKWKEQIKTWNRTRQYRADGGWCSEENFCATFLCQPSWHWRRKSVDFEVVFLDRDVGRVFTAFKLLVRGVFLRPEKNVPKCSTGLSTWKIDRWCRSLFV